MDIKIGVCGIPRKLEELEKHLDAVEVQETFYKPRTGKYKKWRERAPNLEFTVKAWFPITHGWNRFLSMKAKIQSPSEIGVNPENIGGLRPTKDNIKLLQETMEAAEELNSKIIVFQTPGSFKPVSIMEIAEFFNIVTDKGFIPVWEIRGSTLEYTSEIQFIVEHARKLVLSTDILRTLPPVKYSAPIVYTRLHGLGGGVVNYKYNYTTDDMKKLLNILTDYMSKENKKAAYVMFNNIYMYTNAITFKSIIEQLNPSQNKL
jgi:uncharacterized protein YecE (DUF72 family)